MRYGLIAGLATVLLMSGTALAQVPVTATTELNVRAGPGTNFPVVGVIPEGGAAVIGGCVADSRWCTVAYDGGEGWAYSDYLSADLNGQLVVITDRGTDLGVPATVYEGPPAAVPGAVGGAIAGAVIAGPVGAVVGGVAGAAIGAAVDPPKEVRTYVTENALDPVYVDGEVVVGATLPEPVAVTPVPNSEYAYVYLNGVPVLVEPGTRKVVYIFRS